MVTRLRISLLTGILVGLTLATPALSSHFRGAIISWRAVNSSEFDGRIEITHRVAWRRSSGSHYCNATTIQQQTLKSGEGRLTCVSECSDNFGSMSYYCTDFSELEDWITGQRTYIAYTESNITTFEASFQSGAWISLNIGGGNWEVRVKGDLAVREDTGRINTSPVTTTQPIVRLQYNIRSYIALPVADSDGDILRCRWANYTLGECAGVCNAFPFAILDEDACTLTYNGSGDTGWYAVALQVEDFATASSIAPMSSVPVQFLVNTFNGSGLETCSPPQFTASTLSDGEQFEVILNGSQFKAVIAAEPGCSSARITTIQTVSPLGLITTALRQVRGNRQWYINATWMPRKSQAGPHIFCFQAFNNASLLSPRRCITIIVKTVAEAEACNPPCENGNCSERTCMCSEGWTGEDCSTPVCSPPCVNGVCSQEMVCECDDEWIGEDCRTPVCPEILVFSRTLIGETRSLPCSSIAGGSGMIGEMRSTCTSGGVWGSVNMSQCTFRKDVPTLPILWLVELNRTNLRELEQTIASIRSKRADSPEHIIQQIRGSSNTGKHVYSIQFERNATYTQSRERLSDRIRSEITVIRYAGCDCCASREVDLYTQSGSIRLCDVDVASAPVPCSCENNNSECGPRFVKLENGCHLDTDRDGIADEEDPCVGCCVAELNIFEWPKTDHGSSSEASCSQLHPSFGDSKVRRKCRVNDTWDPVDIGSCTFKSTTTRSTPILLFNATVNSSSTNTVRQTLNEQAMRLVPNNASSFNVTEVAFVASSISGQRVVFFVIEFSENTTLEENFITTIKNDTVNLIEAVIPSDNCSCSSDRSNDLRRLCIGTATAPCDCERRGSCKCVDPYIREPGGTCSLDTDGDGIPDYKDICPLEHSTDCGTAPPPAVQSDCPREKDTQWNLLWKQTQRGQTRVQRCPNGITRSAGLASRRCMENGQWGEVDATKCVSRAFQAISENNEDVNRVLESAVNNNLPLTTEERETVVEVAEELSNALDNTAAENASILPGDLTITTHVINSLADLSENNGLFNSENAEEQQKVVANVLNRVLDSDNAPAFAATRQDAPAVTILESTEQLARSGFTNQNISFVPPPTVNQTVDQEEIVQENIIIQSNRYNPRSFAEPTFQVSFPKVSLSAFANRNLVPQIVIPGDFLSALVSDPGATAGLVSLSQNPVDVVSFTMNNLQEHLPLQLADKGDAEKINRFKAGSLIISSQVTGVDSTAINTGPTVNLSFSLLQGNAEEVKVGPNERKEIKCAAWNFTGGPNGTGGWSFDGIEVVSVNDTHVECTSKHLTSFIVLVSVVPLEGPPHPVFNVFTYIGCSISLVCLLLSIIFFISLRKELIKRLHNFVHLNLCIALACGLIVFIGGMEHATSVQGACVFVSFLQHYFFLAAFSWMLCEAVMIYILLVRVFGANDRKWIYLYLSLGWGLPVPIVILSVAIRHYEYFIADPVSNEIFACWLPVKDGVIAAFIVPMLAILLVNSILLTISMASLAKSKCGQKQETKEKERQGAQTAWQLTKAVLILMPLMGFTWVIGLLAVGPGRDAVAFVFIVLNSLQGLFIFILHVVRHDKIWGKIKTRLPTIRDSEGKFTFWNSQGSTSRFTFYRKSEKQSTSSSKNISTLSSNDPGLLYSETKDKPLDLASIKDGEVEDVELKVKSGENTGDEPNPGVLATTSGVSEPSDGEQKTSSSTPPPESTTTPDNDQPTTLATSDGGALLVKEGDPLPPEVAQTQPDNRLL